MKKQIIWIACLLWGTMAFAQTGEQDVLEVSDTLETIQEDFTQTERYRKVWKKRKAYFNFVYGKQSLNFVDEGLCVHSKWAAGITAGRTYYLHKRPLLGMIKFGIDWSYIDLQVAAFPGIDSEEGDYYYPDGVTPEYDDYEESDGGFLSNMYKAEIGMQVGPSVTVNPIDHLKIAAYFRVLPCYSALYDGDAFKGGYATYLTYGASVSYKVISLGVEQRWGQNKYTYTEEDEYEESVKTKVKIKNKGPRFYLSFRF